MIDFEAKSLLFCGFFDRIGALFRDSARDGNA